MSGLNGHAPAPRRKLRIAAVGARGVPSNYSGIETIWENLFVELTRLGHEVTVYCRPGVLDAPTGTYRGLRQVRLPAPGGKNFETLSHSIFSVAHAVARGDAAGRPFDLLSMHAVAPNLALPIAKVAGLPVVSHVHGLDHKREKWKGLGAKVIGAGEQLMVRLADAVAVVNDELTAHYRDAFALPTHLLPNGIHPVSDEFAPDERVLRELGLAAGKFVVGIGRLVPEKRQGDVIEAFRALATDWKLCFVGEGKHTPEYVAGLKARAGDDGRVVFAGLRKGVELETLFRCAGLYVTASELEGLPSSLLECADRGTPALVSDIAAHRQVLGAVGAYDGFFGVGDVGALSGLMRRWIDDRAHTRRVASAAREHVRKHFAWPELARATERVYLDVVQRAGK